MGQDDVSRLIAVNVPADGALCPNSAQSPENILPIVATAGWSVPKSVADRFPKDGSVLERYATVFDGVEINSTFYRRHRPDTFKRWAVSVPETFRFAMKIPKEITHERRLSDIDEPFASFLNDISHLGGKVGPLLCQLAPNLPFERATAEPALALMRSGHPGRIVIEPRHPTWASTEALSLFRKLSIDRVLADPPVIWQASDFDEPPWYIRLHGKPKIYYSDYAVSEIKAFRALVASDGWCVFDNTASGAATRNALEMLALA